MYCLGLQGGITRRRQLACARVLGTLQPSCRAHGSVNSLLRYANRWSGFPYLQHIRGAGLMQRAKAEEWWKELVPEEEGLGPAAEATLSLLGWPSVCKHVAAFTSTALGRESVEQMRIPTSRVESQAEVDATEAMAMLETEFAGRLEFGGIMTDTARQALKRADRGGMLASSQLLALVGLAQGSAGLRMEVQALVSQARGVMRTDGLAAVAEVALGIPRMDGLVSMVLAALDEEGGLRDSASEQLGGCRNRVRTLESRLKNMLSGMGGDATQHHGRWCLAIQDAGNGPSRKVRRSRLYQIRYLACSSHRLSGGAARLRHRDHGGASGTVLRTVQGVVLGTGLGGTLIYIEPPAAVELNNGLAEARAQALAAEEAVLWTLTSRCVAQQELMQHALDAVVWLDVVCAKARYGRWIGGVLPEFVLLPSRSSGGGSAEADPQPDRACGKASTSGQGDAHTCSHYVSIRGLRHPVLMANHLVAKRRSSSGKGRGGGRSESVPGPPVPVDVLVRDGVKGVLITGPNTGGKTASLKAVGLAALMAKCGVPIPATPPVKLPFFSTVLADIGDEQSLSASLSTFSGHLHRIQSLREEADGNALVLLDELGTGTDPEEGAALGAALMQALARDGSGTAALTLASTHHSSLTTLQYDDNRFENASVEFDEAKLAPTYRLLWGVPGRSNALNIASRLGLTPEIIEDARSRLGSDRLEMEARIATLEAYRSQESADAREAETVQQRIEDVKRELREAAGKVKEFRAQEEVLKAQAIRKAVRDAKVVLDRLDKSEQESQHGQQRLDALRQQANVAPEAGRQQEQQDGWTPRVSDTVFFPKLGKNMQVVGVDRKGKLKLVAGFIQIEAGVDEVRRPS